jgi:hypothetical protein
MILSAQTASKDAFLGVWVMEDGSNDIEIIKEGELYYIVEFVRIKHELFFSGDEKRALFQEWGKGPPGTSGLQLGKDGNSLSLFGVSENSDWAFSYIFYRRP